MREHGYVVGRNLALDERYAQGNFSRLPVLADELISLRPDALVGIEPAAVALRGRTTTIPIVLLASPNPVAAGLVQSLSRPGTNVTGLAFRLDELIAKHIELLAEINPRMSRVALFNFAAVGDDPGASSSALYEQYARKGASAKGLTLVVVAARDAQGVQQAFARLEEERPEGLVVAPSGLTWQFRNEIIREARRLRLPSITSLPAGWADSGGLATYGTNFVDAYRYAATYVDRIFKGAKPAELPVEQTTKFEFVINLKTAREIGVKIPQSVLLRADRVTE
jgi:putative ABC transport system substrate-binding protein